MCVCTTLISRLHLREAVGNENEAVFGFGPILTTYPSQRHIAGQHRISPPWLDEDQQGKIRFFLFRIGTGQWTSKDSQN